MSNEVHFDVAASVRKLEALTPGRSARLGSIVPDLLADARQQFSGWTEQDHDELVETLEPFCQKFFNGCRER